MRHSNSLMSLYIKIAMLIFAILCIVIGLIIYRKRLKKAEKVIYSLAIVPTVFMLLEKLQNNANVLHIPSTLNIPENIYEIIIFSSFAIFVVPLLIYGYFTKIRYDKLLKIRFFTVLAFIFICLLVLIIFICTGKH